MKVETISDLKAESQKHRDLAKTLDELIEYLETTYSLGSMVITPPVVTNPSQSSIPSDPYGVDDWSNLTQADACYQALFESNRPLTRQEMVDIASKRNKYIKSADHLSPVLSRDKRFVTDRNGQWDLRSRAHTPHFLKNLLAATS